MRMRLIDADKVVNDIAELIEIEWGYEGINEDIKRIFDDAPTVDAEPIKRGKWILEAHNENVNYRWNVTAQCSECCNEIKEIWAGIFPNVPDSIAKEVSLISAKSVKLSNYCPDCGAKMGEW